MEKQKARKIEDEYFPDIPILYDKHAELETILFINDHGVVLEKREYEILLRPIKKKPEEA